MFGPQIKFFIEKLVLCEKEIRPPPHNPEMGAQAKPQSGPMAVQVLPSGWVRATNGAVDMAVHEQTRADGTSTFVLTRDLSASDTAVNLPFKRAPL